MFQLFDFIIVGFSIFLLFFIRCYLDFRRAVGLHLDAPGFRTIFGTGSLVGNLVRPLKGITPGPNRAFVKKHDDFVKYGRDAYLHISAWPEAQANYFLADAAAIKEVVASRARFPKPVEKYELLSFFGRNIVVSEFDEWKRFRKIAAPSFNEKNNKLVWDETVRNLTSLFDNVWGAQEEIVYDHTLDLTIPVALFVIASAGFGRQISWDDDKSIPAGHKMSFKTALHNVSINCVVKALFPDRLIRWAPTKRLEQVRDCFDELHLYLEEMIRERKLSEKKDEHYDLFSSLLAASELEDDQHKLTDSELIGNIFVFLLAGHETTAHSLCFALIMLSLYPDEQEILFQHIQSVLPDGRLPEYEDMTRLSRCTATLYETIRMFPPAATIPKFSKEDTTLAVGNEAGETVVLSIPRGSAVSIHVAGLHYNPRYWEDPHAFKPARFMKEWNKDAFFETSGVAFLSIIVSRYKIEPKKEPQFAGETFEERRARMTDAKAGITLTPLRAPLVFKRR